MSVQFAPQELSRKYDRFARWYDLVEGIPDLLGVRRLRQRILQQASGKVLEVAAGTGKNLRYYSKTCQITALDLSRAMLDIACKRAEPLALRISFLVADGETLPFSDKSFDTVVSSLTVCTFPNPVVVLQEMARVCRSQGRILLLEHGRSDRKWLGRWQDRRADHHARQLGCHWNREPLELVREVGLKVNKAQQVFFGIFHQIEAEPGPALIRESRGG